MHGKPAKMKQSNLDSGGFEGGTINNEYNNYICHVQGFFSKLQ